MTERIYIVTAALFGLVAVGAGALGAHAFTAAGDTRGAQLVDTGSRYLLGHALAVLAVTALGLPTRLAPACFLLGGLFFSGSLFALALGAPRWVGAVTPFGGGAFMLGWALTAWAAWRWVGPAP